MKAFQINQSLALDNFAPLPARTLPGSPADFAPLRAMTPGSLPGNISTDSAPAHESGNQPRAFVTTRWFQPVSFPVKINLRSRGNITQRVREILC
jgi:hypothetical protein